MRRLPLSCRNVPLESNETRSHNGVTMTPTNVGPGKWAAFKIRDHYRQLSILKSDNAKDHVLERLSTRPPVRKIWPMAGRRDSDPSSRTSGLWLTEFDFGVNACEPDAVIELSEQTIINEVADRLTRKYPTIPPDTLTTVVQGVHARFDGRPVREYVSLLVERFAGEELEGRLRSAARPPFAEASSDAAHLADRT
jgi:hypothetical protein